MEKFEINLQPSLTGQLLSLRPLKESDFEELYAIASDPLIWEQHPMPDRYKRNSFEEYFRQGLESKGAFLISTIAGEIIGSSRYYEFDPQKSQIAIGYTFIARNFWGGKCNRELKSLMLDHAFEFVKKVIFHVGEKNLRSQKALQKIGAHYTERHLVDGRMRLVFEIERK